MAKLVMEGVGDITSLSKLLHDRIMKSGMSVELVGEYNQTKDDTKVVLRVYDKYFYRVQNRVSLSLQLVEINHKITVVAIGSGGASGLMTRFNWGAEEDFSLIVKQPLIDLGFQAIGEQCE